MCALSHVIIAGAAFNWIYWSDTLVCACVCAEPTTSSAKINNQPQSRRRIAAFSTQIYARDAPPADSHRDCIVIICISALFALLSSCAPSIRHHRFRSKLALTRNLNSFSLETLDYNFFVTNIINSYFRVLNKNLVTFIISRWRLLSLSAPFVFTIKYCCSCMKNMQNWRQPH